MESVVRESAYHVIGLKTLSLWVTLTSIPGFHQNKQKLGTLTENKVFLSKFFSGFLTKKMTVKIKHFLFLVV